MKRLISTVFSIVLALCCLATTGIAQGNSYTVTITSDQSVSITKLLHKGDTVKIHIDYSSQDPDDIFEGEPLVIQSTFGSSQSFPVPTLTDFSYSVSMDGDALGGFIQFGDSDEIAVLTVSIQQLSIVAVTTPFTAPGMLHTFVSTDKIQLQAHTTPGVDVHWTVVGNDAASGIGGFPKDEVHTADAQGVSTFSYSPNDNGDFVNNRQSVWKTASRSASPPVSFDVTVTADINGQSSSDQLSQANLGQLSQDERDIVRQEYVDFEFASIPARTDLVASLGAGFNAGNYTVQLDGGMNAEFNAVLAAYRGSVIMVNGQPFTIPASANIIISSGYRNPRRNIAVGSLYPRTSKHTLGYALDMVPQSLNTRIGGKRITIGIDLLNQPLFDAAKPQGKALVEEGHDPGVTVSEADHIHLQW